MASMSGIVVCFVVILVAAISLALGFLLARSRASTRLAAAALRESELTGRLEATNQQLSSLQQRQQADADTGQRLGALTRQLDTLQQQVITADRVRAEAHAQLHSQLRSQAEMTKNATDEVQREARKLSKALSRTNVRGMWGESDLRRLVEAAGMLERVHFDTQTTLTSIDASRRPDLIVHLAGNRDIVVDAKVPLDALLEDLGGESDTYSHEVLARHAAALKSHIDILAGRKYTDLLPDTPELVVLYLPAESLLSLALTADAGLLDHAFAKGVAIATPTTMLALLRTVNHGWRQEAVAQNAREIHALGTELHKRLVVMSRHFRKVGSSLDAAVKAFNDTVGSYETRVLVQARKFSELELVGEEIPVAGAIENSPRALTITAIDLTDEPPVRAIGGAQASG